MNRFRTQLEGDDGMASELEKRFKNFTDSFLADQFVHHKKDYTDEALTAMEAEIERRKADGTDMDAILAETETHEGTVRHTPAGMSPEDFVSLEHQFTRTDFLLAESALRDQRIPFYIDPAPISKAIPLEPEEDILLTVNVHRDFLQQASNILEHHFDKVEGKYELKHSDIKDRLESFNFHDIAFNPNELEEELDVSFEPSERKAILTYAKRLLDEADAIEEKQGHVLFYYDNIEDLSKRLEHDDSSGYSRQELLAILEILQVYCREETFPKELETVAENLLDFLHST